MTKTKRHDDMLPTSISTCWGIRLAYVYQFVEIRPSLVSPLFKWSMQYISSKHSNEHQIVDKAGQPTAKGTPAAEMSLAVYTCILVGSQSR